MKIIHFLLILGVFLFLSCNESGTASMDKASMNDNQSEKNSASNSLSSNPTILFESLPVSRTGIQFKNELVDMEDMNIFNFEYMYNGAGVAVGDINNDGLSDLYFACNQCPNRLYLNKGNFQFEDITESAGVQALGRFKTGVAMVDINDDGLLDIFALRTGMTDIHDRRNYVYLNNGDLTFSNKSTTIGLDEPTNTMHCNFIDYDLDGDLDVFYGNHPIDLASNNQYRIKRVGGKYQIQNQPTNEMQVNKLFRNDNGKFTSVGKSSGIYRRGFALSSIVSDFNEDGYPDIYIGNDYIDSDILYINQKNGKFKDEADKYFRVMSQNTMGSDYEDLNNDGLFDLATLDMLPDTRKRYNEIFLNMTRDYYDQGLLYGYGPQVVKNCLQINLGNGIFSDQSYFAGVEASDWSWASLLVDFNNDGLKDLFITNGFKRDMNDLDFVDFRDQNLGRGFKANSINDLLEMVPRNKVANKLFLNQGEVKFKEVGKAAGVAFKGFSHGAVYADLDNDGDLDLVVNNMNESASIYKNLARENNPSSSNYLSVKFKGPKGNRFGINTKVFVQAEGLNLVQEYRPTKGFMSTVEPRLLFGIGTASRITNLRVEWPDGKTQEINSPGINKELTLDYSMAKASKKTLPSPTIFKTNSPPGLAFRHNDKSYDDFKRQPLQLYKFTNNGPCMAKADVDGNGMEDLYLGGAAKQKGELMLQLGASGFGISRNIDLKSDAKSEDTDALFFDADGDKDMDLYVVSGGGEAEQNDMIYLDRLYINSGKGKFTKSQHLPPLKDNGSCVAAGDFDGDGDLDLFVGSRMVPGRFPEVPESRLLINNQGKFTEGDDQLTAKIKKAGMVTDVEWIDIDGDGKFELLVAGEWMGIRVFKYNGSRFAEITNSLGLSKYKGLWQCLKLADLDQDGDLDLIAGNLGLNSRFKASLEEPMTCYVGDFDNNQSMDPIVSMYSQGKDFPLARRSELTNQLPSLKKKFLKHKDYASATINKLFDSDVLMKAPQHLVTNLESMIFINNNGSFKAVPLPSEAQMFPVKSIQVNKAGNEIILAGNIIGMEVINGPAHSGSGLLLQGQGELWNAIPGRLSGIVLPNETNSIISLKTQTGKELIVAGNHNAAIQSFIKN